MTPTLIIRSYRTYTSRRDRSYLLAGLGPELQVKARQTMKGSARARNKMLERMFEYLAKPGPVSGLARDSRGLLSNGCRIALLGSYNWDFHAVMSEDRCLP